MRTYSTEKTNSNQYQFNRNTTPNKQTFIPNIRTPTKTLSINQSQARGYKTSRINCPYLSHNTFSLRIYQAVCESYPWRWACYTFARTALKRWAKWAQLVENPVFSSRRIRPCPTRVDHPNEIRINVNVNRFRLRTPGAISVRKCVCKIREAWRRNDL